MFRGNRKYWYRKEGKYDRLERIEFLLCAFWKRRGLIIETNGTAIRVSLYDGFFPFLDILHSLYRISKPSNRSASAKCSAGIRRSSIFSFSTRRFRLFLLIHLRNPLQPILSLECRICIFEMHDGNVKFHSQRPREILLDWLRVDYNYRSNFFPKFYENASYRAYGFVVFVSSFLHLLSARNSRRNCRGPWNIHFSLSTSVHTHIYRSSTPALTQPPSPSPFDEGCYDQRPSSARAADPVINFGFVGGTQPYFPPPERRKGGEKARLISAI